jgi:LPXTG-motif cell wall-anchored protein
VIDDAHPLRVFIQLEDDEDIVGGVVKNKSAAGFEVVERMGGRSNATFQYQVVANRADEVLPNGRLSRNADFRFDELAPPETTLPGPPGTRAVDPKGAAARLAPDPDDPLASELDASAGGTDPAAGCSAGARPGAGAGLLLVAGALVFGRRRRRAS